MFQKVFVNILGALVPCYVCLWVGFAAAFHILIPETGLFFSLNALVSVIVMTIGELDYKDQFYGHGPTDANHQKHYPTKDFHTAMTLAILVFFIFSFVIVLVNLVVGVAVADIQELKKEARYNQLRRQAQLIARMEMRCFAINLFCPCVACCCCCLAETIDNNFQYQLNEPKLRGPCGSCVRYFQSWWPKNGTLSADIKKELYQIVKKDELTNESLMEAIKTNQANFEKIQTFLEQVGTHRNISEQVGTNRNIPEQVERDNGQIHV